MNQPKNILARRKAYGTQRSLSVESRIFVLLRDELGLGTSPKVARLLVDEIMKVLAETYVTKDCVKPGEIALLAPEVGQGPSWKFRKLEDKKLKTVTLSLIDDDDIDLLCQGEPLTKVRLSRMVRLVREAYEQGATLTSTQLAMMTGIGAQRVSMQLREYMKTTGETLPTRGIIEDCSPAITHKAEIVSRYLEGEEISEIAAHTDHTPASVERYVKRFEQVRELVSYLDRDADPEILARILRCSKTLVEAYLELLPSTPAAATSEVPSTND